MSDDRTTSAIKNYLKHHDGVIDVHEIANFLGLSKKDITSLKDHWDRIFKEKGVKTHPRRVSYDFETYCEEESDGEQQQEKV